jgi:hypothetical protein
MDEKGIEETPQQPSSMKQIDDFSSGYANYVFLENSFWDLKLVFGQLDQSVTPPTTEMHTAITIPWAQAKILSYLIRAHVAGYELTNGKIRIPPSVLPPELPIPTEEQKKAEPNAQEIFETIKRLRDELVANT